MKKFSYPIIAVLACAANYSLHAQLRVPWKPAPVLRETINDLKYQQLPVSPELLRQTLALEADLFKLYADEFQDLTGTTDDSLDFSKTAKLMRTISRNLTSIAIPDAELELSGKYLKPTLELIARYLKLKAKLFEGVADVAKTSKQCQTANSIATRLKSVGNILENTLEPARTACEKKCGDNDIL